VVEVVVALAECAKRSDDVVAGRVFVIERRLAEPMRERVDAEGRMVDETQTYEASVDIAPTGVAPAEPRDDSRDDEAHEEEEGNVVLVLPANHLVVGKVADVGDTGLTTGFEKHPAHVSVPETLVRVVWVEFGVSIAVVGSVAARPPFDRTLNGTSTRESEKILQELARIVTAVRPEAMVARRYTWKKQKK
jgi:hypothetical protein